MDRSREKFRIRREIREDLIAVRRGIRSEREVPDEAFTILVLEDQGLQAVQGFVKYRPEFSLFMLSS